MVTRGGPLDDVTWQVLAHLDPTGRGLFTLVARQRGQHRATSGMGDHPLPGGRLLDTFAGDADGLPPFALLRAAPSVESVIVHGTHDTRYPIELSATDPTYNLRFGATPLRDHDWPLELTVRLDTGETWSAPYFTPSR